MPRGQVTRHLYFMKSSGDCGRLVLLSATVVLMPSNSLSGSVTVLSVSGASVQE